MTVGVAHLIASLSALIAMVALRFHPQSRICQKWPLEIGVPARHATAFFFHTAGCRFRSKKAIPVVSFAEPQEFFGVEHGPRGMLDPLLLRIPGEVSHMRRLMPLLPGLGIVQALKLIVVFLNLEEMCMPCLLSA